MENQQEQAKAKVEEAQQGATTMANGLVEQARHTATEVGDRAAGLVNEGRGRVQEAGGRVAANLEHVTPEAAGALVARARRYPLPVAAVLLLALAALVIWLMRRD